MITLTKAQFFTLPKTQRKKHKDGTCWAQVRRGTRVEWEQVKWLS